MGYSTLSTLRMGKQICSKITCQELMKYISHKKMQKYKRGIFAGSYTILRQPKDKG